MVGCFGGALVAGADIRRGHGPDAFVPLVFSCLLSLVSGDRFIAYVLAYSPGGVAE